MREMINVDAKHTPPPQPNRVARTYRHDHTRFGTLLGNFNSAHASADDQHPLARNGFKLRIRKAFHRVEFTSDRMQKPGGKQELAETQAKLQPGLIFRVQLPPEADAHYAGKGVSLGAADTPIFWYRPKDSETYRVIYADLSVREADAPPNAPNAPNAPDARPVPAPSSPKESRCPAFSFHSDY
jgi:hypothetical protein